MLDPKLLTDDMRDALTGRGHTIEKIAAMSPELAFEEYCDWHGLIGWGSTLIEVLDAARAANK